MSDPRFPITCPGCGRPLGVPPTAVGRPAHCPHCRAVFDLPANPDGTPGVPVPRRVRPKLNIPRLLFVPAVGLVVLGIAGTFVGGFLAVRFATVEGADRDYARGLVRQIRGIDAADRAGRPTDEGWPQLPHAAVLGAGLAAGSNDVLERVKDERLAAEWGPSVAPINRLSLLLSVATLAGGAALVGGRFYWLALAGCVAAAVNVNHLCCIPGAMLGGWGVLGLVRDEGRAYFGIRPRG